MSINKVFYEQQVDGVTVAMVNKITVVDVMQAESSKRIDYTTILTNKVIEYLRDSVKAAQYEGNDFTFIDEACVISNFSDTLTTHQYKAFNTKRAEAVLFKKLAEIEAEFGLIKIAKNKALRTSQHD